MKIANIIYNSDLVNHNKVEYINYINEPKSCDEIDFSLPTLYVGWNLIKESNCQDLNLLNKLNILNKTIIPNYLYFEFSFEENKKEHIYGVEKFVNYCPKYFFFEKYEFECIDPVFKKYKSEFELFNPLPRKFDSSYNYKNEIIYILVNNKIYSIDLKMHEFFKFNTQQIIDNIRLNSFNYILDGSGSIYKKYSKIYRCFGEIKRYLVVICKNELCKYL